MMELVIHQCSCGERWGHGLDQHVKEAERHHSMGHKVIVGELETVLALEGKIIGDVLQVPSPLNPDIPLGGTITEFSEVGVGGTLTSEKEER